MIDEPRTLDQVLAAVRALADEQRERCLWFLREDAPRDAEEASEVLRQVGLHGDRAAFQEARRLEAWLSRHSSARSAGSSRATGSPGARPT